ncbi:hypothetical protein [Streptomyces sp. NBC_00620]|uniref:hypothetical protein n=1 Tax=Streptomyces sp. NBC_00620 TaxID=2903666 RepID=UPI00225863BE|nr:hypothetical protein [Streptomyces sp. NBC_00620]MCX4972584.1 hypothetical protein [Streptomyces sp. NBC_00620]
MSHLDYEQVLHRVDRMAAQIDKAEELAQGGDRRLWRTLFDLRLAVHRLQREMRGGQALGEATDNPAGNDGSPGE